MPEPTPPELDLNYRDWVKLDSYRIDRFRSIYFGSMPISVAIDLRRTLLIVCTPELRSFVLNRIEKLTRDAWIICGCESIAIYCKSDRIYQGSTRTSFEAGSMENNAFHEEPDMAVASPVAEKQIAISEPSITNETFSTVPVLKNLSALAARTGLPAEQIAQEIVSSGYLAFFDEESGAYKASEVGMSGWIDNWLDRDRDKRRAELMATFNNKVDLPPEPKPKRSTTNRKAATAATTAKPRFKTFEKARSYSKTIGNFLAAQNFEDADRIGLIEAIGQLPVKGELDDSPAARSLNFILSKYEKAQRSVVRSRLIRSAQEMQGKEELAASEADTAIGEGDD